MSTRLISRANAEDLFAKKNGVYPDLTAGTAEGLIGQSYEVDQSAYLYRKSHEGGRVREKIIGGTVAWNQIFGDIDVISASTSPVFTASVLENNAGFNAVLNTDLADKNNASRVVYYRCTDFSLASGHKYLFIGNIKTNITSIYKVNGYLTPFADDAVGNGMSAISDKCYYAMFIANTTRSGSFTHRIYLYGTNGTIGQYFNYEDIQLIDLTQMFGSTIADYIYSLEQANAGAGVAWFKKLFPKDYYEYNAGELISVEGLESRDTVGFNQMNPNNYIIGTGTHYNVDAGTVLSSGGGSSRATSEGENPISVDVKASWAGVTYITEPLIVGQQYQFTAKVSAPTASNVRMSTYIINESNSVIARVANRIGTNIFDSLIVPTASGQRFAIFIGSTSLQKITVDDMCFHLVWSGYRNGEYEPYEKHSYPLDNSLTLRGIPKLDNGNNLYYDGDEYASDGSVTRRYGVVDLGTLNWTRAEGVDGVFVFTASGLSAKAKGVTNLMASNLVTTNETSWDSSKPNNSICGSASSVTIVVRADDYTDATSFKSAMNGVYLVYELATPTTETADPYAPVQAVGNTERWIDSRDVPVPVGQNSKYYPDYAEKIDSLPSDFSTLIAPTEVSYTATRNYAVGDYFIVDNVLYCATAAISTGTAITPDSNCRAVTIMEIIKEILDAL